MMVRGESREVWWKCVCLYPVGFNVHHYDDVIMSLMASQITSLSIVYSTDYSRTDQRKKRWIPHTKGPVTWRMVPFDNVIVCVCENKHPWHPISGKWLSSVNSHLAQEQGEYLWSALKREQVCWTTDTVFYLHAAFVYKNCRQLSWFVMLIAMTA